jgi:hypothetical protein
MNKKHLIKIAEPQKNAAGIKVDNKVTFECGPCCTVLKKAELPNGLNVKLYATGKVSVFDQTLLLDCLISTNDGECEYQYQHLFGSHIEHRKLILQTEWNKFRVDNFHVTTDQGWSDFLDYCNWPTRKQLNEWYEESCEWAVTAVDPNQWCYKKQPLFA